jgi:transposase
MSAPISVRPLSEQEQQQVNAGLHSCDAFVLRRCQILLASARGERATVIARQLGCDDQTVRNVIHGFNATGLAVLQQGSSRPHRLRQTMADSTLPRLREVVHRGPRSFGKDSSVWTLEMLAEVCFAEGLTSAQVSGETIRRAVPRLGESWKRAKHRISSPDGRYQQKNGTRPTDGLVQPPSGLGHRLCGSGVVESLRAASVLV